MLTWFTPVTCLASSLTRSFAALLISTVDKSIYCYQSLLNWSFDLILFHKYFRHETVSSTDNKRLTRHTITMIKLSLSFGLSPPSPPAEAWYISIVVVKLQLTSSTKWGSSFEPLPSLISLFIFVWSISEAIPKNNWMRGEQACLSDPKIFREAPAHLPLLGFWEYLSADLPINRPVQYHEKQWNINFLFMHKPRQFLTEMCKRS